MKDVRTDDHIDQMVIWQQLLPNYKTTSLRNRAPIIKELLNVI